MAISETPAPDRRARWALGIGLCLLWVLGIGLVALMASSWRPESPSNMPPFEATAQRCEVAFGHPFDANSNMEWLHRPSRLYSTGGWSVIVSFDEQGQAEQFIFSKTKLPLIPIPPMNRAEQATLLDKFKEGSTWAIHADVGTGPVWTRADGKAYAYYFPDRRWMLLMNYAGMKRSADALQRH